jgi:hypothetical protein
MVLRCVVVVEVTHTVLVGSGVLRESVALAKLLGRFLPCRFVLQVLGYEHGGRYLRGA